jgi:hypothetical protein
MGVQLAMARLESYKANSPVVEWVLAVHKALGFILTPEKPKQHPSHPPKKEKQIWRGHL